VEELSRFNSELKEQLDFHRLREAEFIEGKEAEIEEAKREMAEKAS
jgi:hypothetical protein